MAWGWAAVPIVAAMLVGFLLCFGAAAAAVRVQGSAGSTPALVRMDGTTLRTGAGNLGSVVLRAVPPSPSSSPSSSGTPNSTVVRRALSGGGARLLAGHRRDGLSN